MKKSLFALLLATMASFAQNGKIHLEAEITNPNSDSIVIHNKEFKTTLRGKGGIFSADIDAPRGFYQYFDGREFATLYLNSGYDLRLKADGKHLNESLSFSGSGSAENNYLVQKKKNDQKIKQGFGGKLPTDVALQQILDQRMTDAQIALSDKNFGTEFPALMRAEYETENQRIKTDLASVRVKENGLSALKNTKAPESQWIQHFKIEGIPRFILIGKDGSILDPDAPRPSSGETAKLISNLL